MQHDYAIIFNNFSPQKHHLLYGIADRNLTDNDVAETACHIAYHNGGTPSYWPFNENYIEIVTPDQSAPDDRNPVLQAGLETARYLDLPAILTRKGARSIIVPVCKDMVP